ncbi:minichromosome maintenance protein 5 [Orobanche gracilis]
MAAATADTAYHHPALQKFKEFIRNFQHKIQPNVFPYRETLLSNPIFLLVDFDDLISLDPGEDEAQSSDSGDRDRDRDRNGESDFFFFL